MNACDDIRPLLDAAPLGPDLLEAGERARLDAHVAACVGCRGELAALAAVHAAGRQTVEEEVQPMSSQVRERLVAEAARPAGEQEKEAGGGPAEVDPARLEELGRRIALSCSYCHGRTTREEIVFCAACVAPHHAECFALHGGCSQPGCGEKASVRPLREAPAPPRRRTLFLGLLGATFVGAAAFAGHAALRDSGEYTAQALLSRTARYTAALEEAVARGDAGAADEALAQLEVACEVAEAEGDEQLRAAARQRVDAGRRLRRRLEVARVDVQARDADLRIVAADLARKAGVNIVVAATVNERVTLDLRDIPWTQALRHLALTARCRIESRPGGILHLVQPPAVTIQFTDANIRTVIQLFAAYSGMNVVIEPAVQGNVTLDLKDVTWDEALIALGQGVGFQVGQVGRVLVCRKGALGPDERPLAVPEWTGDLLPAVDGDERLDVQLQGLPLRAAAAELARRFGRPVEVRGRIETPEPDASGRGRAEVSVTVALRRVTCREAVEAIAASGGQGLEVAEVGETLVIRAARESRFRAEGVNARTWVQALAALARVDVVLSPDATGVLVLDLRGLDPVTAIDATARSLGWSVERAGDVLRVRRAADAPSSPARAPGERGGGSAEPWTLQATLRDGDERLAIIRDRVYRAGDVLVDPETDELVEGLRLVTVEDERVELRQDDQPSRWVSLRSR